MDKNKDATVKNASKNQQNDDLETLGFAQVRREEIGVIKKRRQAKGKPLPTSTACERNLFGVALSGGGIRSATFNLGILQILARYGLLRRIDYLSLNSGGGYIGGWLSAWIKRDGIAHVEDRLASDVAAQPVQSESSAKTTNDATDTQSQAEKPDKSEEPAGSRTSIKQHMEPEPYPISHLRRYTNYLTPKVGLFSIDTWVLIATYLRNFLLNLVLIGLASTALIYAVRAIIEFSKPIGSQTPFEILGLQLTSTGMVFGIAGVMLFLIALATFSHLTRPALVEPTNGKDDESEDSGNHESTWYQLVFDNAQYAVVLPTFIAAVLIAKLSLQSVEGIMESHVIDSVTWVNEKLHFLVALLPQPLEDRFPHMDNPHWALFMYFFFIWLLLSSLIYRRGSASGSDHTSDDDEKIKKAGVREILTISFITAAISTLIIHFALWFLGDGSQDLDAAYRYGSGGPVFTALSFLDQESPGLGDGLRVVFGAPVVVTGILLINVAFIGLSGRRLNEQQRQWWSRLGAWLLIYSIAWLLLTTIVHVVPELIAKAQGRGFSFTVVPILIWLALSATGAYSGHRLEAYQEAASIARRVFMWLAPIIFIVGLLVLNTMITSPLQEAREWEVFKLFGYGDVAAAHPGISSIFVAVFFVLTTVTLSSRIDVNQFSMHNFYRARLVRAFLAASRGDRAADKFTNFSHADDFPLADFKYQTHPTEKNKYDGPIPIYNCSLNLAGTNRLALQERKADSFAFTPYHFGYYNRPSDPAYVWVEDFKKHLYVGVSEPAYCRTSSYESDISVGLAMATSGAAISPAMGFRSTASLAFLLTVFNVRLGAWVMNPRKPTPQRSFVPKFGFASLFGELLARTNEDTNYVYLSDGGHFENLAVYELVRRRCRYIIATDAAADPKFAFLDLGNLIRKCRSDFGINIEIDLSEVRPDQSGLSKRQFAVGKIRYDQVDEDEQPGFLVYIKSSITGNETVDIASFRREHPSFPHQSTADQWFTESQFDSYRALGFQIGDAVLANGGAKHAKDAKGSRESRDSKEMPLEMFFSHLRHAAYPASKRVLANFTNHAAKLQELLADISKDPELEFLDRQLFPDSHRIGRPETTPFESVPDDADRFRRGFYFCNRLLQLMENVFIDLNLEGEFDHPDNRGWLNLFRYWAGSDMLRLTWSLSASTYGARFQKFCDEKVRLLVGHVDGEPIDIRSLAHDKIRSIEFEPKGLTRREQARIDAIVKHLDAEKGDTSLNTFWVFRIDVPLLGISDEGEKRSHSLPCGFAITDDKGFLVYIRIRDHMRGLGLARRTLEAMQEKDRLPMDMAPCARNLYKKIARDPERGRYFELLLYSMAATAQLDTP